MKSEASTQKAKFGLEDFLGKIMVRNDLAEIVPITRRSRYTLRVSLMLLILWGIEFLGLLEIRYYTYYGQKRLRVKLLCLVLALLAEAWLYRKRHHISFRNALLRHSLWERIRPPFYWVLAGSISVLTTLVLGESLFYGLGTGALQWLTLRAVQDSIQRPEQYKSFDALLNWISRVYRQVNSAFSVGLRVAAPATIISFALNLIASEIWESVGNTDWNRLFVLGGGLYLLAFLVFGRLSKSMIRVAIQKACENWDGLRISDLQGILRSVHPLLSVDEVNFEDMRLIDERLQWKNIDNLVSRVCFKLETVMAQRVRWTAFFVGLLTFLFAVSLIAVFAFLTVPRKAIEHWAYTERSSEPKVVLAIDDFEELLNGEFRDRFVALDRSIFAQEPLPKVAFLEAAVVVSLLIFRSGSSGAVSILMVGFDASKIELWLTLGTAYLTLLENEFQCLYTGSGRVELTHKNGKVVSIWPMVNEVLLVPPETTEAGVRKALCEHLQINGPLVSRRDTVSFIVIFSSYYWAQTWALRFLRFSSLERPYDLYYRASKRLGKIFERYWVWRGGRLKTFYSFEEMHQSCGVVSP